MRKGPVVVAVIVSSALILLSGCPNAAEGGSSTGSIIIADAYIVSMTPIHNNYYDVSVTIDYSLSGVDQGEIIVAFNNGTSSSSYDIELFKAVDEGGERVTYVINTLFKDWSQVGPPAPFQVFVSLDDNPDNSYGIPLDTDIHELFNGV